MRDHSRLQGDGGEHIGPTVRVLHGSLPRPDGLLPGGLFAEAARPVGACLCRDPAPAAEAVREEAEQEDELDPRGHLSPGHAGEREVRRCSARTGDRVWRDVRSEADQQEEGGRNSPAA